MKAGEAVVGMPVWVYAMGSYYAGEVIRVSEKGLEAKYTSGAGKVREKWFPSATGVYAQKGLEMYPIVEIKKGEPKPLGSRATGKDGLYAIKLNAAIERKGG